MLRSPNEFRALMSALLIGLSVFTGSASAGRADAQASSTKARPSRSAKTAGVDDQTISALMVSDIHFDPFHDPAKIQQLVAAPAEKWSTILASPSSQDQQKEFDALQQQCHARGVDTPYLLLQSSLQAMHTETPKARFMTVSGDLIAHAFPCRYKALVPGSEPGGYQAFVLKTIAFVIGELRSSFPGVPVYVALGNNDSGCGDYQLDTASEFLSQAGKILAEGLPASEKQNAIKQFAEAGNYSVKMALPMRDTRLIVINDMVLSAKYTTCAGVPNAAAGNAEMEWLKQQLADARQFNQKVWVMGHIPPGVNPYATISKMKNMCTNAKPDMFLLSDQLSNALIEGGDTIRLGIFAHTHMDEMRLLEADASDGFPTQSTPPQRVLIKMVSSISPVDGNNPSFTVANVNPATAVLQDYEVIAASNQTGVDTKWSKEYDYAQTYHEAEFSTGAVRHLMAEFKEDRDSKLQISNDYMRNYFVGDRSFELKPFWPQYVCALTNATARSYAACVCSNGK